MKKMNKLAAAVTVALSLGVAPHINAAPIELKPNGVGDTLLFPVFIGYSNFENYFTISNNHNRWVAGHIRFRGAAWSGEILDFPVILSPGDVFVFRIADIDGQGNWAIDQSLDPKNFAYTNQLCADQVLRPEPNYILIPSSVSVAAASGQTAQQASDAVINHHKHAGYIEFFGTAVLDGMSESRMAGLLNNDNQLWQNKVANPCNNNSKRGTTVWAWSNAEANFATDQGLSDVPNVLSGNGFIGITGIGPTAIAYNAEAFVNFRTPTRLSAETFTSYPVGTHRIENYTRNTATAAAHPAASNAGFNLTAENRAIILYHEDANSSANATSPAGDYLYSNNDNRLSEAHIAFNNTWGPTLQDGDDYNLSSNFTVSGGRNVNVYGGTTDLRSFSDATGAKDFDNFESSFHAGMIDTVPNSGSGNSIAEVEEAIRLAGQSYKSVYVDGSWFDKFSKKVTAPTAAALKSYYIVHFPTKFFHFENGTGSGNFTNYLTTSVNAMLASAKSVNVEVWDIFENIPGGSGCVTSPCIPTVKTTVLGHELNFFTIGFFKNAFTQTAGRVNDNRASGDAFTAGRVVLSPAPSYNDASNGANLGRTDTAIGVLGNSYPMLGYTFEATSDFTKFGQWRSMQR
jgi:hypothetical protein